MSASPEDVFKAADKAWREKGGLTAKTAAYAGMDGAEKTAYKECLEKGTMNGHPSNASCRRCSRLYNPWAVNTVKVSTAQCGALTRKRMRSAKR